MVADNSAIDFILERDERLSMCHVVQSLTNMGFSKDEISDAIKRYLDSMQLTSTPQRCWINAPSSHSPYHPHHGANVLAVLDTDGGARVYFVDGTEISMQIDPLFLSSGWINN